MIARELNGLVTHLADRRDRPGQVLRAFVADGIELQPDGDFLLLARRSRQQRGRVAQGAWDCCSNRALFQELPPGH